MRLRWLIVLLVVVFSIGLLFSVEVIQEQQLTELDVVAVNDIVQTAQNNWGNISQETFSNKNQLQFSIIDNVENVIYQTADTSFINLDESLKQRDVMVDLKQNNEIIGKVILENDEPELLNQMQRELMQTVGFILGGLLFFVLLYLFYLYRTILAPFQQLQQFAKSVARGNLDQPLNRNQSNYFGAFTDSFDLLREELYLARQREYESNQSKKELVATLSHDIKTPVASIKAVSELMLLQAKDEKIMHQINTVHAKAEQIDLLVTDMFHATLEELEQLNVSVTEVSSSVLIDMFEQVNFDSQIVYDPLPPCLLSIDPVRMQQVIDNVVSNSYKYAGTRIIVTSCLKQNRLELQIMDFGPGVDHQEIPLLFNKYYRGKRVEGKNGSGLGLYISKYFMNHMGALISCHNRTDGFTVVLTIKLAG